MYCGIKEEHFVKYYYYKFLVLMRLTVSSRILFKNLVKFYISFNRL